MEIERMEVERMEVEMVEVKSGGGGWGGVEGGEEWGMGEEGK